MPFRTVAGGLALAVSIVAQAAPAAAGEATDALREFFAEGRRIIMDAVERQDPNAGLAAARQLIHRAFDVRETAARVLGREWDLRTPGEQDEFAGIFSDLMERAYLSHVVARLNNEDAIRVHYLDETRTGDTAVVETTVQSRAGVIPFQYRMVRTGGRWTVRDVAVDGVSIVESYRAQFARVIRRSSYAETIATLRERNAPGVAVDVLASSQVAAVAHPSGTGAGTTATERVATTARALPSAPAPAAGPAVPSERVGAAERVAGTQPSVETPPVVAAARGHDSELVGAGGPGAAGEPALVVPPAAPIAPRVARTSRQTSVSAYWVQIGAFQDASKATRVIEQLGSAQITISTAGDSLLRLRVGPFPDRAAASSTLRDLERRGFRPFIVETKESPGL